MTMYQIRTLMGSEDDMRTTRQFEAFGNEEVGILTADDQRLMYEAELSNANERFIDRLMERIASD